MPPLLDQYLGRTDDTGHGSHWVHSSHHELHDHPLSGFFAFHSIQLQPASFPAPGLRGITTAGNTPSLP